MTKQYDVIVVGAGHNGLVHAAYLARAGLKVLVLERRHLVGGAAVTEEVFPGFKFSVCSYVVSLLRPEIIRDLDLAREGLEILPLDCSFTPLPDGNSLARWSDSGKTYREIARHSKRDAEIYPTFGKRLSELARFIKPTLDEAPPSLTSLWPSNLSQLLDFGKRAGRLGKDLLMDQARLMSMSAVDFLDRWFECEPLRATLSVSGIIGTFLGVRSPGTAYVLLHHYMGEIDGNFRAWGFSRGGMGAVSEAIAGAARRFGAEIRTQAPVAKFLTSNGQVRGVVLENGDELHARIVSSAMDPRRTFLGMMQPKELPDDFRRQIERYKMRGSSGKVNLALDRAPEFSARPGIGPHLRGDIAIAPNIDYLERAYDQAKYGEPSKRPYCNIVIPSLTDPTLAPPGKHVLSAFVQYAPYDLADDDWDRRREEWADDVVDTIAEYVPGLHDMILHRQALTPLDLEREFGLTEGNIFHGELTPDQLFFLRPAANWTRFRTPLKGLYLCASGAHPGGGVMGAPGRLAALAVLQDSGRGKGR
jgi:phytoene dehydrogenase-like protein